MLKCAFHVHGCRVVQQALQTLPIEQQLLLVGELKSHEIACIEDQNANHVIQKCIECLPAERIQFIVDAVVGRTTADVPYLS